MDILVLALFCGGLLLCVLCGSSILYALAGGLVLFLLYGAYRGFPLGELLKMAASGIKTVKNILITFVLIGVLTALWRDAGTIAVMVCYASGAVRPSVVLLMSFLLNCMVSMLTGTAFGTAATMGVICMTMASAMRIEPALIGGAVLSGAFFGDRCSPVSTSALLVSELTGTDIFDNIRRMLRSAAVPFGAACGVYLALGLLSGGGGALPDLRAVFGRAFALRWTALLPAAAILTLSLLRVSVKRAMLASIAAALPVCVLVQHTPVSALPRLMLLGYQAADGEVAAMLNGGGIVSMARVGAIVCLSSAYSGIFQRTGLLDRAKRSVRLLAERTCPFDAVLCASIVTGMVACNQTLAIMLTHQLCREEEPDPASLALHLEDSVVVTAPLVPWSIAGATPLASIGAPGGSLLFACFLYLLPLWRLLRTRLPRKRDENRSFSA